jgi:hypothetical protein
MILIINHHIPYFQIYTFYMRGWKKNGFKRKGDIEEIPGIKQEIS